MVSIQLRDISKKWLLRYLMTSVVALFIAGMALDGCRLLLAYVLVNTPVLVFCWRALHRESFARHTLFALVLPLVLLGLSALLVEWLFS